MGVDRGFKRILKRFTPGSAGGIEAMLQGIGNQSQLINDRFKELIEGLKNQSQLLNAKFNELLAHSRSQDKLLEEKLSTMIARQDAQVRLHREEIALLRDLLNLNSAMRDNSAIQSPPGTSDAKADAAAFNAALGVHPLMIAAKTYNTSHPDYDANLVRNVPGTIFNADKPCNNTVYAELRKLGHGDQIPSQAWDRVLKDALDEAKTVPHAGQVFERRQFIEQYMRDIAQKYRAHYAAGWVNLDDAVFLYWLVRRLKPKTIVQTGVCNGLSSAFMMLALAKNGPDGRLHVIDLPPVFDPNDPKWTTPRQVYGVVIPEGRTTGWMVPDAYRDRFEVWNGDAKDLMPKMVDKVSSIDMFYHDSDHTYDHMMFEFREAKRKLRPGGLMIGDDISWNASLWDFADQHGVPSYNFKGAVGVAFF